VRSTFVYDFFMYSLYLVITLLRAKRFVISNPRSRCANLRFARSFSEIASTMSPLVREYALFCTSHLFLTSPRARTDSPVEKNPPTRLSRVFGIRRMIRYIQREDSGRERGAYFARSFRALSIQPPLLRSISRSL